MNFNILNNDTYLLLINKNLNKELFISNANVKEGTYAFSIVERIYEMIFSEIINLKEEFINYYSDEYTRFEIFLRNYYNLDEKLIQNILDQNEKDVFIGNSLSNGDNVAGLIYNLDGDKHEEIIEIINLLMEVHDNEN